MFLMKHLVIDADFEVFEQIPKGDYLLQTAANSALGRLVIELAKQKGVKTINVVRKSEAKEELYELG